MNQSPGGGFLLPSVGLGREYCLERDAKSSMGLDFPWLHGKTYRGEMYPLMVELRGMSVSGEGLTEGGHPLALMVLSITLIKCSMGSSLRLTPSCVRPLDGSVVLGAAPPPAQAAAPACRLVGGPGGELLCRAHADAQWNWHSPSLLLHHAWLMGPFSFKLFSLSFSLFVCF